MGYKCNSKRLSSSAGDSVGQTRLARRHDHVFEAVQACQYAAANSSFAAVRDAGDSPRIDQESVWDNGPRYPVPDSMLTKDRFRVFQEELAALEKQDRKPEGNRMEKAKAEFLALKRRYALTVADVVTFFPEEEGIAYLETLIAKPVKPRKQKAR
jgi:hypothetical protein